MRSWRIFAILCLASAAPADELPRHILNLARIERQMTAELKRLPNYTCLETIDRYTASQGGKLKPYDRIRINVALVDGKELYSWPGARTFDDRTLGEMIGNGFVSDGDFAAMTKNIFMHRTATIAWVGPEPADPAPDAVRKLLRYDFHISQMMSGWQVRLRSAIGTVGAKGSFWVDAGTLELVRLSFAAEDLPPFSHDKSLEEIVDFGRVKIGIEEILLPITVDLEAEAFDGTRARNHESFSGCRQYGSDTTISFGDENEPPVTNTAGRAQIAAQMPGGLAIPLRLDTPLDSFHAAVGDEVRAIVAKDVRFGEELLLPRGAVVSGVIRRLDQHTGNMPYYEVGLEFNEAVFPGHVVTIFGRLDDVSPFQGYHRNAVGYTTSIGPPPAPGVGYFYVEGSVLRIPKGIAFTWQTQTPRSR